MNKDNKNISSSFVDYLKGKLNRQQQRTLEKKVASDPFYSDAMDGFLQFPSAGLPANPYKRKTNTFFWLIGASLVLVIGFTLFSINNKTTQAKLAKQSNYKTIENSKVKPSYQSSDLKENQTINKVQKQTNREVNSSEQATNIKREEYIKIHTAESEQVNVTFFKDRLRSVKQKTFSYYGFIAVECVYCNLNSNKKSFELTGLKSPYEAYDDISKFPHENNKISYTYKSFYEEVFKLLSQKRYNECVDMLKLFEEKFPNDVNAQFYLGLVSFNLYKYSNAINYFDLAISNQNV